MKRKPFYINKRNFQLQNLKIQYLIKKYFTVFQNIVYPHTRRNIPYMSVFLKHITFLADLDILTNI